MKSNFIKRIMCMSLMTLSLLGISSVGVSAEWKQDSNGWWNTEGDSYSVGWKQIDGKWYYFGQDGYMAHDTIVNGYKIDNNGVWTQNTNVSTTTNSNNVTNTNLTTNSNNMVDSNNKTNVVNNINNGTIINGNITNSNNTQQNYNDNQINSNDYNKTEPIIEGNFTDKENNIFPCWTILNGKYYHLDKDKQVDYDTSIDGYKIGSDGAWIQDNSINPPNVIILPYGFQLNAQQTIDKLKFKAKNNEIRQDLISEKHNDRISKIKELQDKIKNIQNNNLNNGDYWIQIYQNQIKELQLEDK